MERQRETAETGELRTFGRRRGRKLSARQQRLMGELLPRLSLDLTCAAPRELRDLFGATVGEVWLEIGFGGGEQLIWQAERNPGVGFIACEPFVGGMAKALTAIEARRLTNIRLYGDDARHVLRWLPGSSISRTFVLFPDPWPKKRHRKRRFISRETLGMLGRVMRCGAELRIATDVGDYAHTILLGVRLSQAFRWLASAATDWRTRPADWPATRYEEKAIREGRHCTYLRFIRVGRR
jgi:tRNA (guanine-N7-)-methyltransferase